MLGRVLGHSLGRGRRPLALTPSRSISEGLHCVQ
jgi:hypothetical protein